MFRTLLVCEAEESRPSNCCIRLVFARLSSHHQSRDFSASQKVFLSTSNLKFNEFIARFAFNCTEIVSLRFDRGIAVVWFLRFKTTINQRALLSRNRKMFLFVCASGVINRCDSRKIYVDPRFLQLLNLIWLNNRAWKGFGSVSRQNDLWLIGAFPKNWNHLIESFPHAAQPTSMTEYKAARSVFSLSLKWMIWKLAATEGRSKKKKRQLKTISLCVWQQLRIKIFQTKLRGKNRARKLKQRMTSFISRRCFLLVRRLGEHM